jgi:hypothetical protein
VAVEADRGFPATVPGTATDDGAPDGHPRMAGLAPGPRRRGFRSGLDELDHGQELLAFGNLERQLEAQPARADVLDSRLELELPAAGVDTPDARWKRGLDPGLLPTIDLSRSPGTAGLVRHYRFCEVSTSARFDRNGMVSQGATFHGRRCSPPSDGG